MGKDFVTTGQGYLEHGAGKDGCDNAFDFDCLVLTVVVFSFAWAVIVSVTTAASASSFGSSCDIVLLCWFDVPVRPDGRCGVDIIVGYSDFTTLKSANIQLCGLLRL
jgi:hypothetical protein